MTFLKKTYHIIGIIILFALLICDLSRVNAMKEQNSLFGKIIYIDAGHGGKDNGANVDNVLEDNINLNISVFLAQSLIDLGANVMMSRTSDYDLASMYDKNRKRTDLLNRVKYINKYKPDVFVSIHLNTYTSSNIKGPQVFYQNSESSKSLSNIIQKNLNNMTNNMRISKFGDYFILNSSKYTGVLVECGFLSNDEERIQLSDASYQKKIAYNIKNSLVEYFLKES